MQPTHGEQWALPLVYSRKVTVPHKTRIVATTDPSKPKVTTSTVTASCVGITRQKDGTEWIWWSAKGSYLRAAVLVNGELPIVHVPKKRKPKPKPLRYWYCRWCDHRMVVKRKGHKFCSRACLNAAVKERHRRRRLRAKPCPVEGCRRKGFCKRHQPHGHHGRAKYWGVQYEPIIFQQVYDRDGWICGLCSLPVDKKLKKPDVMRVSLDHIIPLSRGGDHLWDNVQCSHLLCNMRKHNRMSL